jgi:predicted HTH domain antitoxin
VSISFDLPPNIEQRVRMEGGDPSREAMEAYLIDLYRQERITHDDLGDALGLSFHQTEQLLKDHGVGLDFTLEEFEAERAFLRTARER